MHEGTAVWVRPDLARATHAKAMREQCGIRTIAETDDNYLSNPRLNIFLRVNRYDAQTADDHMKAVCSMNGIVFSTEWLRDYYYKKLRKRFGKRAIPALFVCRNNVAEESWPERVESNGRVRVGWMGSPSHVWDVDLAYWALRRADELGAETWMIGFNPAADEATNFTSDGQVIATKKAEGDSLDDESPRNITVLGSMDPSTRSEYKKGRWSEIDFKHIPWQPPKKHHRFSLPLDIGLCPLLRNHHTLGKSDVKFLEYTISGAATIAMNNEVYNRTMIHGETGILCNSPWEMRYWTEKLIFDEKLRLELVANAQQYVREERGGKQMRQEWMEAING
jgi:glycosyltransferase involved in cell wall biosynthesis